ncbi:uncharacterized protein E5676_scaffold477G00880 [Cucumis melo var. makuwa]|uniref:Reverse transcriptase n=1 Tax=Cucumis melo var. makuwa TaxID=1194695 RepID=A0A5A7TLC8_CUCMM|nr:uncharacterized protein E6C27_scaffold795G001010 [Cucumis melo var. makuwa]TYK15499.1 uncharacterized protein E5676_scaffold477G00880 [Cucumis melo var. makuwa]
MSKEVKIPVETADLTIKHREHMASLIMDSDGKSNQAKDEVDQIDEGEKTRIGAIKYMSSLQKKSGERHVPTKGGLLGRDQTSKTLLGEGLRKNEGREFHCPTYRQTSETNDIELGGWKGPVDFVVVKMDNFDVVLRIEFLLEYQVIPMPSARCLVITGSFSTVLQADIRQPNGFKMILVMQLEKSPAQEEPPSAAILLGALRELGETVPKDTLCVSKKCHDVLPNSWPKFLSMRRTIDHKIELLPEAKASTKNVYRMAPPELAKLRKPSKMLLNTGFSRPVQAPYGVRVLSLKMKDKNPQQCIHRRIQSKLTVRRKYPLLALARLFDRPCGVKYFPKSDIRSKYCRVRTTKAKGLETTCVTEHEAYEFPVVPLSLTDAKGGKCCSVQSQINVLGHVGECHQSGLLREKDTQWSGNLECQAAFNCLKQAMIKGPSLGIVNVTKTPKVEAEQFSCVLGEYLHHCVDGRQKNWVQLLKVAQFDHSAQTDSLIKRSSFEIKGKRHYVLPPLADGPYVGDRPEVHRVGKEWEQMADITRVCLEEASRPMEERVDQKRCPLEFEWMTKLPISGATMSPTREIHKFLVKRKKPLVEITSGEHVEDLEVWTQKIEELQLRQLTRTSTVYVGRMSRAYLSKNKCRTIVFESYDCDTMCYCLCVWAAWVALVPGAGVHLLVPMGCACSLPHGAVMGTCLHVHAGLVGCLPWAHTNVMGVCRGPMWAVTWSHWGVVRAC